MDEHVRWIFPRRPPCPKCGKPMTYSGSSATGRCRYVGCPACGHRGQIVALGREVRDAHGQPRLRV